MTIYVRIPNNNYTIIQLFFIGPDFCVCSKYFSTDPVCVSPFPETTIIESTPLENFVCELWSSSDHIMFRNIILHFSSPWPHYSTLIQCIMDRVPANFDIFVLFVLEFYLLLNTFESIFLVLWSYSCLVICEFKLNLHLSK